MTMLDDFEIPNDRVQEYRGFKLVYTDPFGLVHASNPTGPLPYCLEGEWTGIYELQKKIDWYLGSKEQKENKPPLDKNTRRVQEIMKERGVDTLSEAIEATFAESKEEIKKYVEPKKGK